MLETLPEILSVLSSAAYIFVVIFYLAQIARGDSTPNPATWFIWLVIISLNAGTYYFVTDENLWKVLTPTVIALGILSILIYSLFKGRLAKIGVVEVITLLLCIPIGIYWRVTADAVISNLMVQIIILIAYIPTVVGLAQHKLKEKPLPWVTGMISYVLLMLSIVTSSSWNWVELAFPFFNGIVGNGSVVIVMYLAVKHYEHASND